MTAHHVGDAVGPRAETRGRRDADRRTRATSSSVLAGARSTPRACASFASSSSSASPGIGKSRLVRELRTLALGFTQLTAAAEQYASSTPFFAWRNLLRQLVGITPDRSREQAGAQLCAVRHGGDARPRAVAAAARDPVRRRRAVDAGGRRARPGGEPRQAPRDRRDVPRARADDADAARLRGRALARRLVAVPAPPPHRRSRRRGPWLVCVTTRPGAEPSVASRRPGASASTCSRSTGDRASRARAERRGRGRALRARRSRRSPSAPAATRSSSASSSIAARRATGSRRCRSRSRAC